MSLQVEPLTGQALQRVLPALAQLRIAVFRDYPYLYDGTLDYEEHYLERFAASEGSVIVVAEDAGEVVGASTGAPLVGHAQEFAAPFLAKGYDLGRIFYFGESVLLKSHRGRGIGHAFFDHREAHARGLGGFAHATFCAVVRPADHPLRPAGYVPLDTFWAKRGYAKVPGLITGFTWKDIDRQAADEKPMQFWMRTL
jgi:GNAT superfamily N-acetyltransferase